MRETFPREAAVNPEPFTGERLTGAVHGQVEIEHYHRYLFARALCRDKDVLDVASGEGYGTAQLAQVARYAIGIEYAGATVANAVVNFPGQNLRFVRGDARSLPLADACADIVTSFETIEHFDRQADFVREVRRVLRPGGLFIVSTPDREIYNAPGAPTNPYHVHEFDRAEFLELLHRHFKYIRLVRQRPMIASALFPEEGVAPASLIFERNGDMSFEAGNSLPNAPYLIAIAGDVVPDPAPVSLLIERGDLDHSGLAAELTRSREAAAAAATEADAARAETAAARIDAEAAGGEAAQLREDMEKTMVTLAITRSALVRANDDLDRISGSLRHFLPQYLPKLRRFLSR